MKLSRSTGYGLLAVAYIAQNKDKGLIVSQDVSKKYNIPLEYLLKIMQQMVKARILQSKRGPRGGFSMARPVNKITLLDVVEAIEGSFDISLGFEECGPIDKFATKAERVYAKAVAQNKAELKKVKLSDLI
ncbi:MAG: RrF2 family transcriptional regulator [Planctomycetota bacterium]|jgi:Rrf2 family protein